MDEYPVRISDLEDVNQVLGACLNYLQARDLMEAQVAFTGTHYSPLTDEVGRLKARFAGYLGDYLLERHEGESEPSLTEDADLEVEESQEPDESLTEASEAPLAGVPLGSVTRKKRGRRLKDEEIVKKEDGAEQPE